MASGVCRLILDHLQVVRREVALIAIAMVNDFALFQRTPQYDLFCDYPMRVTPADLWVGGSFEPSPCLIAGAATGPAILRRSI
jgi:hypothetical protein